MTTASLTPPDLRLRDAVVEHLDWDSQVDASGIGVINKDGVVTLTGFIDSYAGKLAAERTVKRVGGVRAVANDIQVRLRLDRTDTDIATDAVHALNLRVKVLDAVQVVVHNGHVTLTGTVRSLFQRAVAEKAVRHTRGLKGVVNRIQVTPEASGQDVRRQMMRALHLDADVNARAIAVTVTGDTITLTGSARTWHERESAEYAAMHAPGITRVDNHIFVDWADAIGGEVDDEIC